MKRFILIAVSLCLICGAMFYYVSIPRNVSGITAMDGVLNLVGEDFAKTLFTLDGEWEFYYGKLYTPKDFRDAERTDGAVIGTPGSWKNAGYPLTGCATYRLVIMTDEPMLTIQIPKITFSSVVWLNGQKVFVAGKPGATKEETEPSVRTAFVNAFPENGRIEIVVQAANYNWFVAGLRNSFLMGRAAVMQNDAITRYSLLATVIGALLVLALYHFILFLYRRDELLYFAFALTCLASSSRIILETNGFAQLLLPGGVGIGLTSAYIAFLILQTGALLFFTHIVFEIPVKSRARKILYGLTLLVPSVLTFVFPYGTVNELFLIICLVPLIWSAISAGRSKQLRNNPYNGLFLFAVTVFILWYPFNKLVLNDALFMPAVATNLFLILSQCIMLAVNYSKVKKREEHLAERNKYLDGLNRMKTEFLQDMSHEMKNPLTVIATGTDYADSQITDSKGSISEARSALDTVRNETQRLGRMVRGMVQLASISEINENRKRVNFASFLKNSADTFRIAAEKKNVSLFLDIEPNLPEVFIETDNFMRVMTNLLSNATNYTQNGQISLAASYIDSYITVRVSDTGDGIEPGLLPNVFERGVSGGGGTGYGLYLCKTIVEAHGGTIKIENSDVGGTTVTFTVPVYGGQEAGHKR